jgi:hypothetical protein
MVYTLCRGDGWEQCAPVLQVLGRSKDHSSAVCTHTLPQALANQMFGSNMYASRGL